MIRMPVADLLQRGERLIASGERVAVLWQAPGSIAFLARGREYRSEFHINPADEVMYMVKGEMRLHYRQPDGSEEVAVLPAGSAIFTPAGVPHSPRFAPGALLFVIERGRQAGEVDRFHWYCGGCGHFLHEERFVVADYAADPVSQAYRRFFASEALRTCAACGEIMPAPAM
jgi:3-hydroxyanthranilate 3,4-dioxygenase